MFGRIVWLALAGGPGFGLLFGDPMACFGAAAFGPTVPPETPLVAFGPGAPGAAQIALLGVPEGAKPISPWLAGVFTEHLGQNVYLGAWAQMLSNPVFAPDKLFGARDKVAAKRQATAKSVGSTGGDTPSIADNVAVGWLPFGQGAAYEFERDPGPEKPCRQTLEVSPGQGWAGLMAPAYFPFRRTADYTLLLSIGAPKGSPTVKVRVCSKEASAGDVFRPLSNDESIRPGPQVSLHKVRLKIDPAQFPESRLAVVAIGTADACSLVLERAELYPDDALDGWDPEVVELWKKAGVRLLRFPGGNFTSGYHWKDGIGPREKRPVRKNPAWGGCEPNLVGADEWLRFCELIGAEPLICVNAGNGAPEEAADWVQYCNGSDETPWGRVRAQNGRSEPYNVHLWEAGNELYGDYQVGHCTAEEYAKRYDAFARAMRWADPSIRLLANGFDLQWDRTVALGSVEPLETFTLHRLLVPPASASAEGVYRWVVAHPVSFVRNELPPLRETLKSRSSTPHLALTELMIMHGQAGYPRNSTIAEAVFYAGMLNGAIRSGGFLDIVTRSALLNHGGGMRKQKGIVFTDPVYDAFCFYSPLAGAAPAAIRLSSEAADMRGPGDSQIVKQVPQVDAVAGLASDGQRLDVVVLNRSLDTPAQTRVQLGPWASRARGARLSLLACDHFADSNSVEEPRKIHTVESDLPISNGELALLMPKHSLAAIRILLEAKG